tara:strand:+ start:438 stop:872 length:435 start_codon:yes stop_codon:yes gene_type:complete
MKAAEIKDKTKVELSAQSRELRQELFNLRLQKATSQLEKPIRLRELRRDIARVETRLSQLERKDALGQAASALEGVSDFNVDGVAATLRGLTKGDLTRKDVFKTLGGVFNPNLARVTTQGLAELVKAKGKEKAVASVKAAAEKI